MLQSLRNKYQMSDPVLATEWSQSFTFYTMKGDRPLYIPKEGLITWEDLLFQLQDHTNFQFDFIEVVINNQRVYYNPQTKLLDIGIKKGDVCVALKQPSHKTDKERKIYSENVDKRRQICLKAMFFEMEKDKHMELTSLIDDNKEYQSLLIELTHQFQKMETMLAIVECEGDRKRVLEMLRSGKAAGLIQEEDSNFEKGYLRKFMQSANMQEVKTFLQKDKVDEMKYRSVIQKIYQSDAKFKEFEPRHQTLVRKELLGLTYLNSDSESDGEEVDNQLLKQVFSIMESAKMQQRPKLLTQKDKDEYITINAGQHGDAEVRMALAQANNHFERSDDLVQKDAVEKVEKLGNLIKRSSRINIVLQFFARPEFERILNVMKGDPKKAGKFVEWVIIQNEDNIALAKLIARYKDYAVTFLSGEYTLQKQEKDEHTKLKFEEPLSLDQQRKLRSEVEGNCSRQLVEALKRMKVKESLAIEMTSAARNNPQALKPYLILGGLNKQFDFCPSSPQAEQTFLFKRWRKEKDLLKRLRDKKQLLSWLCELQALRPRMFDIIVRNKTFFDQLVAGKMDHLKK